MLIFFSDSSIPYGYHFHPTPEEILYYLKRAINGEPLPSCILIEGGVYGENREPWKIFDKHCKESFWVFTKLKRKSISKIDRIAGRGCWHGRNRQEIKNASGQLLGFDKYFIFKDDTSSQGNGYWVMHEFSLSDEGLSDYVFCKIKCKYVAVSTSAPDFGDYLHLEKPQDDFSDILSMDCDAFMNGLSFEEFISRN